MVGTWMLLLSVVKPITVQDCCHVYQLPSNADPHNIQLFHVIIMFSCPVFQAARSRHCSADETPTEGHLEVRGGVIPTILYIIKWGYTILYFIKWGYTILYFI